MEKNRILGLTTFQLKMIAIVTMLVDHIGYLYYVQLGEFYTYFRIIGRIAFPIFCFLLVEGFIHTRNRLRYIMRLGIFCLLSEPAFDLAFYDTLFYVDKQNVFFTLFIGFAMIVAIDSLKKQGTKQRVFLTLKKCLPWLIAAAACQLAYLLKTDYDYKGILLILGFYCFRENQRAALVFMGLTNFFAGARLTAWIDSGFDVFVSQLAQFQIQDAAILAIFPIILYNGQKGKSMKWFFYLFYPMHLLLLYGIKQWFF